MTSSLVGSEMCIRDRQGWALTSWGLPGHQSRADHQNDGQQRAVRRRCPVSYTHLTLPTICSV
eukprot:789378-Prorocentrum_lima.AAC.1